MSRLKIKDAPRTPDIRRYVGVCMTCRHWQIDVRPGAVSDLGGAQPALMAMAQAHVEHLDDCPGAGGRVNFDGQWVDPPLMKSGRASDGTLEFNPLPRWWVTR
ncbi:hypothetical protein [Nocardioides sp. T2.26MG-1]|uniref:hypothetical protein n=1 Tax=Nocardioides sp. T2.26MG-1 TaxID=3041166 RepID=UPI0024774440|nr:hypothetical protein [Nocardioides sp. T2.26MG-1]CAI9417214.1 hypothetical protein HIDPHFAB_02964 [Nocardioides sp. T2.26MG-1]